MSFFGWKLSQFWKKQLVDQSAHFLVGAVWVGLALPFSAPGLGMIYLLLLVCYRELVVQWPVNSWWDTIVDSLFFFLGGLVVSLIWLTSGWRALITGGFG